MLNVDKSYLHAQVPGSAFVAGDAGLVIVVTAARPPATAANTRLVAGHHGSAGARLEPNLTRAVC